MYYICQANRKSITKSLAQKFISDFKKKGKAIYEGCLASWRDVDSAWKDFDKQQLPLDDCDAYIFDDEGYRIKRDGTKL